MPQVEVDLAGAMPNYPGPWYYFMPVPDPDAGRRVCDHCEVGWVGGERCWCCGRFGRLSSWWAFVNGRTRTEA